MRQSRFTVLFTLTIVGVTVWLSPGASAFEPMDLSPDVQAMRPGQAPALPQSAFGQSLLMAQSTEQKKSVKNEKNLADKIEKPKPGKDEKPKSEKPGKPSSDRMANYKCLEYCLVVRQSCEGLATIQPDVKIAAIGSKENNEWSRTCQKTYNDCMNKCQNDEAKIHWKRSKITESEDQKKERSFREK